MTPSDALVEAMVFGKAQGISPEDQFLFARLGLSHALSASGFHMVSATLFVTGIVRGILRLCMAAIPRYSRGVSLWEGKISCLLSVFFMLLLAQACGWQKPMVRAFVLALLWCLAKLFSLSPSKKWILAWSLVCSSFWGSGGYLSFALSALATSGLFFTAEYCSHAQVPSEKKVLLFSLVPFLATLPLVLYFFALLPGISPLANIVFCPLLSFIVLFPAFASLGEKAFFSTHFLWELSVRDMEFLREAMFGLAKIFPFSYWVPWKSCLLLFFCLVPFGFFWKKPRAKISLLLLSGLFLLAQQYFSKSSAIVLDIGQGDSILLQNKEESYPFLIDAGPSPYSSYPSRSAVAIEREGINSLEGILITHPDADHYAGLESLLLRHRVKAIWITKPVSEYPKTEKVLMIAKRAGVPVKILQENGAYKNLACHWERRPRNSNNFSPLCKFTLNSGKTLLLTGDMDQSAEDYYRTQYPNFLRSDYLKVAHHGSKTSSGEDFLHATNAGVALISVGRKNRYHHPTPETLERLEAARMKIHRTDQEGSIQIN